MRNKTTRQRIAWWVGAITLFLTGASIAQAQGPNHHRIALNVGWQLVANRVAGVATESVAIGVGTVRMDIRPRDYGDPNQNHITPQHYATVMDQFAAVGIDVLVVFGSHGYSSTRDAGHFNTWGYQVCNHYHPTGWGNSHVINYLNTIGPYVDAIRYKSNLVGIEIWNEVTNYENHLCAADYAYMITEAKLRWPSLLIGTSTESHHDSAYSWQFMEKLNTGTDKVNWYKYYYGGVPWDVAMHHPYSDQSSSSAVNYYLWYQSSNMKSKQPRPVWFTEIGWRATIGLDEQNRTVERAIDHTINNNYADKIFWYQMYNCDSGTGDFGLKSGCNVPDNPYDRRPAWWTLENRLNWK